MSRFETDIGEYWFCISDPFEDQGVRVWWRWTVQPWHSPGLTHGMQFHSLWTWWVVMGSVNSLWHGSGEQWPRALARSRRWYERGLEVARVWGIHAEIGCLKYWQHPGGARGGAGAQQSWSVTEAGTDIPRMSLSLAQRGRSQGRLGRVTQAHYWSQGLTTDCQNLVWRSVKGLSVSLCERGDKWNTCFSLFTALKCKGSSYSMKCNVKLQTTSLTSQMAG